MSYFIQDREYDMNMHAKIQGMKMHGYFVNKFLKIRFMELSYKAIM
jgi:hypothetical protein